MYTHLLNSIAAQGPHDRRLADPSIRLATGACSASRFLMSASSKRIQNELAEMSRKAVDGLSAGPKNGNIYAWSSAITGPAGVRSCRSARLTYLIVLCPMSFVGLLYYQLKACRLSV